MKKNVAPKNTSTVNIVDTATVAPKASTDSVTRANADIRVMGINCGRQYLSRRNVIISVNNKIVDKRPITIKGMNNAVRVGKKPFANNTATTTPNRAPINASTNVVSELF